MEATLSFSFGDSLRGITWAVLASSAQVAAAAVVADTPIDDRDPSIIASLSADTDNLFVCLSARDIRKDLEIVARAYEEENVPKLYRAGANHVVSPNASGAIRMATS